MLLRRRVITSLDAWRIPIVEALMRRPQGATLQRLASFAAAR